VTLVKAFANSLFPPNRNNTFSSNNNARFMPERKVCKNARMKRTSGGRCHNNMRNKIEDPGRLLRKDLPLSASHIVAPYLDALKDILLEWFVNLLTQNAAV